MALVCKKCNMEMRSISTKTVDNEYILRKKVCPTCKEGYKTIEIKEELYNDTFGFLNSLSSFLRRAMKDPKSD